MKHIHGFLKTPPLWTSEQFGISQFEFPLIDLQGFVPQPIPENLRLGHQIEHIFRQLLEYDSTYEVLAHNIQLKREKTTLGELDFLLRKNKNRQLFHVELTYKFYILDPAISEPSHRAMGPNRKDMFFTKMEKTKNQQFPLLHTSEGLQALETIGVPSRNILQQCYFLAQLFVPFQQKRPSIRPLNTRCVVGFWITMPHFNTDIFKGWQYYIPYKYEWLHEPHLSVQWQSHYETMLDINVRHLTKRTPMIWIRKHDDTFEKCFVVWW